MEKEKKGFFSEYKEQIHEAIEDLKTKGRRHKQIPNILTTLRLTAPFIIIPSAYIGNVSFIIGATAAFGLTDLADGIIARKFNLKSKLGADLDAFADKIFAGTLLLAASVANPWLLINVGMEMAIAGININQKAKGKEAASSFTGKVKTFALFALAGAGILSSAISPAVVASLAVATTGLQALTINSYLKKYKESDSNKKEETNDVKPIVAKKEETKEETTKEKTIEAKQNTSDTKENPEVIRLREMRDFLTHEKELTNPQPSPVKEEVKVYKKN